MEGKVTEKAIKKARACTTDIGPISPDKNGEYQFTNLKPGYYALVVCWNIKEQLKKPIMAYQKGEFGISYFQGAKYNSVATGKVFYLAGAGRI